jgi:uncharacterized protein (DUF983 family)
MEQIAEDAERPVRRAISRGFMGHCPRCNQGRIFRAYLKVNDACPHCGLELCRHRADDAPPYVTILIVGHVLVALMLLFQEFFPDAPVWVNMTVWPALAVLLSLWLLPRVKGALIGYEWHLYGNQWLK